MTEPEIKISISLQTMRLLEMYMREGDTYDDTIRKLIERPSGLSIKIPSIKTVFNAPVVEIAIDHPEPEKFLLNLHKLAAHAKNIRDDIAQSVDLVELAEWSDRERHRIQLKEWATSAVMKTENVLAFNDAVKAVFDE